MRYRSAPWDDILDDDILTPDEEAVSEPDTSDAAFVSTQDSVVLDSPVGNLIGKPPPPTHHVPCDHIASSTVAGHNG
jgi:hypothetical protein